MGIIQRHSFISSLIILLGFGFGAINLLVLMPKIIGPEALGLTRVITDAGMTLATLCTFGTIQIIYKFFPFYKSYLIPENNDLPFVTGAICLFGFIAICFIGFLAKDLIIRKYSERSPLFVEYSYLVYPFCFCLLSFMWLESFGWSLQRSVLTNGLRELVPRIFMTILLGLMLLDLLTRNQFLQLFSVSYLLSAIILYLSLKRSNNFRFIPKLSSVSTRMGKKMAEFGLFIFGAQFLNLLSKTVDTFILAAKGDRGLTDTAVFTIATYIVTLMEVPQRSLNAVTIPILSEAWKNRDLQKINNIYQKSVSNLLVIGLAMTALIWLNISNLSQFLGKDFTGIEYILIFMGLAKLIDLGTGANGLIIGTSNFWRIDFITNLIYSVIALPLNYVLITKYGLKGAAYSNLISLCFYNALRFGFLWYKFNFQPYSFRHLLAFGIAFICLAITWYIPTLNSYVADSIMRTVIFCSLFVPAIFFSKISLEVNAAIEKYVDLSINFFRKNM